MLSNKEAQRRRGYVPDGEAVIHSALTPPVRPPHRICMGKKQHDPDKERLFVRPITGAYSLTDELKRLRSMPRVIKGKETKLDGGPQHFSRHYIEPEDGLCQTLHIHLEEYAPGGTTQKHGHVNEAAFYILDGAGYEIHDGVRYDWKAGDIAIVHNNCVHQHFNASEREPARALVIKTKPMYLFMNMLFQKRVTPRPSEPTATQGDFQPRVDADVGNHPWADHDHDRAHDDARRHEHAHH